MTSRRQLSRKELLDCVAQSVWDVPVAAQADAWTQLSLEIEKLGEPEGPTPKFHDLVKAIRAATIHAHAKHRYRAEFKSNQMRALSFHQPHGSLLSTGAKPFETRNRITHVRGEILLHAAARPVPLDCLEDDEYAGGLLPLIGRRVTGQEVLTLEDLQRLFEAIPTGAFFGIGEIIGCYRCEEMSDDQVRRRRNFGDFQPGRFAWEFANVRRFTRPIPGKGHQGFFFAHLAPADLENNPLIPVS